MSNDFEKTKISSMVVKSKKSNGNLKVVSSAFEKLFNRKLS